MAEPWTKRPLKFLRTGVFSDWGKEARDSRAERLRGYKQRGAELREKCDQEFSLMHRFNHANPGPNMDGKRYLKNQLMIDQLYRDYCLPRAGDDEEKQLICQEKKTNWEKFNNTNRETEAYFKNKHQINNILEDCYESVKIQLKREYNN